MHLPVVVGAAGAGRPAAAGTGASSSRWSSRVSLAVLFASYRLPGALDVHRPGAERPAVSDARPRGRGRRRPRPPDATSLPDAHAGRQPPSAAVAALAGVHKRYGKTVALAGLDLDVRRGELLAVLGPNGAGKSTAISLLARAARARRGRGPAARPLAARRREPPPRRRDDAGGRADAGAARPRADRADGQLLRRPAADDETLELTRHRRRSPIVRTPSCRPARSGRCSSRWRSAAGRRCSSSTSRPSASTSRHARRCGGRSATMVAQGCSIVLTTHYLEEAEALADRVAVLAGGRLIASGTVDEIRSVVSRKQISCRTTLTADEVRGVAARRRGRAAATRRLQITVARRRGRRAAAARVGRVGARRRGPPGRARGGVRRAHEGGCVMIATSTRPMIHCPAPALMPLGRMLPRLCQRGEVRVAAHAARAGLLRSRSCCCRCRSICSSASCSPAPAVAKNPAVGELSVLRILACSR